MRKRALIALSLIAVVLLAIPLLALCFGRSDSVNARSIASLQLFMTEGEVERVLGRPADSEAVIEREESGQMKQDNDAQSAKQYAPGQMKDDENGARDQSEKMGEDTGTKSGDRSKTSEHDTNKTDQPERQN